MRLTARWKQTVIGMLLAVFGVGASSTWSADPAVLQPRVPRDQIDDARADINAVQPTPDMLEKGKAIFYGKGFCSSCHGLDGKGLGHIAGLRGALPRNFTDQAWQKARTDGELMWILKNGSSGTAMAKFVPRTLTEEKAWQVILFVRRFGNR